MASSVDSEAANRERFSVSGAAQQCHEY